MVRSRRALLAPLLSLSLLATSPVWADTTPFALIVSGGFAFQGVGVAGEPVTLISPDRTIHLIVNGAKDPNVIGHATIALWNQTDPANLDPFFAPFRPLGALGVLQFDPPLAIKAHLGFIDTPGGVKTTIGVLPANASSVTTIRGTWLAGPAQGIGGAGPDDMVVVGELVTNATSLSFPVQSGPIDPYFPLFGVTPPFSSVGRPTSVNCGLPGDCTGSFHGQVTLGGQARPYRGYTVTHDSPALPAAFLHLGVIHTGGDSYVVVACSLDTAPTPFAAVGGCSVSGAGPFDSGLTGFALYNPPGIQQLSTILTVSPFIVLP